MKRLVWEGAFEFEWVCEIMVTTSKATGDIVASAVESSRHTCEGMKVTQDSVNVEYRRQTRETDT